MAGAGHSGAQAQPKNPGIQEHGPVGPWEWPVLMDSGFGPSGHPGMTDWRAPAASIPSQALFAGDNPLLGRNSSRVSPSAEDVIAAVDIDRVTGHSAGIVACQ